MIPDVLRIRTELSQLQYPPPTTEPIPCLAPPKLDVLKCRQCNNFNVRQFQAMTKLPNRHSLTTDYIWGQGALDDAPNFISPRENEQKISCIMGAFNSVIDRCENTVRCTTGSHNILCWLLSSRLESRRESPFDLVAEKDGEVRYRRTQKQFLAFVFRLYRYRMASGARQDVTRAKVRPEIYAELDRIWNHDIWYLFEISKGTWPVLERQEDDLGGHFSTTSSGLSVDDACDTTVHDDKRTCAKESGEDEEGGNALMLKTGIQTTTTKTKTTMMTLDTLVILMDSAPHLTKRYPLDY